LQFIVLPFIRQLIKGRHGGNQIPGAPRFHGKFIDCSEYPEFYFREHGEVSLAHGYGPLYINSLAKYFEDRLATALEDDSPFEAKELAEKWEHLHCNNPPCFEVLLNLLEGNFPLRETSPAIQKA
jgi:hypothetical protein